MTKVMITTAGRPSEQTIARAKEIARELDVTYIHRNKQSVNDLIERFEAVIIVVGKERLEVFSLKDESPFFFHPNAAMFRAKRWLKAKEDPLVTACKIQRGDRIFDGTLGLASDAILTSLAVGHEGEVIGSETSRLIAYIVKQGLQTYKSGIEEIDEAMRRITVEHAENLTWLCEQENDSVDIVYFDPMFEEAVKGSTGFDAIRPMTSNNDLSFEIIEQAKRVAKKRVVLKDHFRSERFDKYGFNVQVRPSATYHYGVIELSS
ncbi:class I SAM-dependent methyltransferase [Bacillus shivajii]|uniref:class I SAM-dependent methyltransferase n=1 Tax=Bacillus shivajii TaxID=1983719 RepID=UPI001CFBF62C|nr:class I SAM-dependent methyltransferase [Bacillus shivajii]UCZ51641.1 class I SAM-dependent methyltransferase [Bacillus shivajii]